MSGLLLSGAAVAAVLMLVLWLVQRARRDAGIVDVGWSAGVGLVAILYALLADGPPVRRALVGVLAAAWSFRLAGYLLVDRVLRATEEDGRYRRMREWAGERADFVFLVFFEAQAALVVLFSVPLLVAMRHPSPHVGVRELLAVAVWIVSVAGESLADRQLARFRADPANRGKTCRGGLWRYSRHPNYFFEWLHWWTYVVLGIGAPAGWLTLTGPVVMLVFLLRVTGIPYTEAQAVRSRGEDYREYQRTTSAFFPWFPRR